LRRRGVGGGGLNRFYLDGNKSPGFPRVSADSSFMPARVVTPQSIPRLDFEGHECRKSGPGRLFSPRRKEINTDTSAESRWPNKKSAFARPGNEKFLRWMQIISALTS
jgi:hypothetical protein